ncbi:unnamed protein product [Diatraea saccharalis]|uniref:Uncharacterized protein n=1 Tax=Diatraea saccharalis TaxID=40085 RepID=A0A9N9QXK3_9NEOP|nr:unnamed protein product [Diatraea saccharalis]
MFTQTVSMGAKQSKRSVDISGKEAEGAGEVAAAGAGGEGRVEQLADVDALKPQLNGDAHIHEQTDKEKQLDSGTPENEKDATTEKEAKQEESEEKEAVVNGDNAEQKTENGESAATPEESKKPKKEKAAEVPTESEKNEDAEAKTETEIKEEKTPETPVTEPITNGSNTPESPKEEIVPTKEVAPVTSIESEKPETKTEPEPQQLPINGLSIDEPIKEEPEVVQKEESKTEESPAESTETVPAVEIPVQKEVCVDQMPLIESTPPPLPANPPPSSVATFAASTMAPDLTDASLANTAETAISTPPIVDTKAELPKECLSESSHTVLTNNESDIHVPSPIQPIQTEVKATNDSIVENLEDVPTEHKSTSEINNDETEVKEITEIIKEEEVLGNSEPEVPEVPEVPVLPDSPTLPETLESDTSDTTGDLPPPPPPEDDDDTLNEDVAIEKIEPPTPDELREVANVIDSVISNAVESNGIDKELLNGNIDTKQEANDVESLENATIECNGNTLEETHAKQPSAVEHSAASQPARASPEPQVTSGSHALVVD